MAVMNSFFFVLFSTILSELMLVSKIYLSSMPYAGLCVYAWW